MKDASRESGVWLWHKKTKNTTLCLLNLPLLLSESSPEAAQESSLLDTRKKDGNVFVFQAAIARGRKTSLFKLLLLCIVRKVDPSSRWPTFLSCAALMKLAFFILTQP